MQAYFKTIKAVTTEIAALLLQATGGDLAGNLSHTKKIASNIMITASTMAHIIASGEKRQLEIEPHLVLRVPSSFKAETSTTKNACETNQCSKVCIVRNKMPQAHGIPRNQVPA